MPAVTAPTSPSTVPPPVAAADAASSILFPQTPPRLVRDVPSCFADLNLDQLVTAVTAQAPEHRVEEYLYTPLGPVAAVEYRQAVFADLGHDPYRAAATTFTRRVEWARRLLGAVRHQHYEIERQHTVLRAALAYVEAVARFRDALAADPPASAGLRTAARRLDGYTSSAGFRALTQEASNVARGMASVVYRVRVHGPTIEIAAVRDEPDQVAEVLSTFARFQAFRPSEQHRVPEPPRRSMNHVEAAVAGLASRLYPAEFEALAAFAARWTDFVDPWIGNLERELRFCLAWLAVLDGLDGLPSCLPRVRTGAALQAEGVYDLVLALKRGGVVTNDLRVAPDERILVVTGPNQGGKTTFARALGQLGYLASLGLPVPARRASVPLVDTVLTHFQRGENTEDQRGGLEDELVRLRGVLAAAGRGSLVIANEAFSSTSLEDARELATRVLRQLDAAGSLVVWVTFLDELVTAAPHTLSLVAQVDPDDPAIRTFEVRRQPPDGVAHALALARKHRLTAEDLAGRLA